MNFPVLRVLVVITLLGSAITGGMVSHLKCFTNVEATEMKLCQEEDGFTSCFTKYNLDGRVVGRGCSDKGKGKMFKEPVFEDHCETFKSKGKTENYCYCSYYLCNELSVTSKSPSVFGDKIFLIVIFIAFGIN